MLKADIKLTHDIYPKLDIFFWAMSKPKKKTGGVLVKSLHVHCNGCKIIKVYVCLAYESFPQRPVR